MLRLMGIIGFHFDVEQYIERYLYTDRQRMIGSNSIGTGSKDTLINFSFRCSLVVYVPI